MNGAMWSKSLEASVLGGNLLTCISSYTYYEFEYTGIFF